MVCSHQSCDSCGQLQRFEFSIDDSVWNLLPLYWKDKVLCIECFLRLIEQQILNGNLNRIAISLDKFQFLGIVGVHTSRICSILLDDVK
ncbi:MAG: hypothetical protein ISP01_05530 [Methanobrevibacter arboriphilus]|uniref:Uncharacterized protein n=1 Tax=Methanobrevibacter arboriphilus TaxID=39441 RepID=A0A843APZ9_METAZ|nr:hypothetical protein [Methanobrevibacter arboriphilus]MBF4468850.1 hypothetical protein [Methanobrevibacter arboriphilus]